MESLCNVKYGSNSCCRAPGDLKLLIRRCADRTRFAGTDRLMKKTPGAEIGESTESFYVEKLKALGIVNVSYNLVTIEDLCWETKLEVGSSQTGGDLGTYKIFTLLLCF